MSDPVNHPPHYTSHPSGVECITFSRHMMFNTGNAFKYVWRAGLKSQVPTGQDLEKAQWYIRDELKRRAVRPCLATLADLHTETIRPNWWKGYGSGLEPYKILPDGKYTGDVLVALLEADAHPYNMQKLQFSLYMIGGR